MNTDFTLFSENNQYMKKVSNSPQMKWTVSQRKELPTVRSAGEDGKWQSFMSVDNVLRFYAFVVIRYDEYYRPKGFGQFSCEG